MSTRRRFLAHLPALGLGLSAACSPRTGAGEIEDSRKQSPAAQQHSATAQAADDADQAASAFAKTRRPLVISTWPHGLPANAEAWAALRSGKTVLDAVEAGARVPEADPAVRTVGLGAYPDRDGNVTLDASIVGPDGRGGAVAYLQNIAHPISVARRVMEQTPHLMLVGRGAYDFARAQGFAHAELLTDEARREYEAWKRDNGPERPAINIENHDTIGLLAVDAAGQLAGACTTSGAAYKYAGRVGDSPIIGAGLYVDNDVGAATATGWGEAVIRACGSFLVVELMRQGLTPQAACEAAVARVISKNPDWREIQVGFIAVDKAGATGAYCIAPGFSYAVHDADGAHLIEAKSEL